MSLSETQIGGLVRSLMRKHQGRMKPVFGIRSPAPWRGPEDLTIDGLRCRVVQVDSPLQAREEILRPIDDRLLVLVTAMQESALGMEVLARMAPQSLQTIHPWASVRERFGAARLDPRVTQLTWLAEALLALPDSACAPVSAGVLDLNHALGALMRGLGLPGPQPTAEDLLAWAHSGVGEKAWVELSQVARTALREVCRSGAREVTDRVFDAVEFGTGRELVAVALALDVLSTPEARAESTAAAARVRAERYFGPGKPLDDAICRGLGKVARSHVERMGLEALDPTLRRAENLLKDVLLAGELVECSDLFQGAIPLRQSGLAAALTQALRYPSPEKLEAASQAARRLASHRRVASADTSALRTEMALRLVRWLVRPTSEAPRGLGPAARMYLDDGAWVDRARRELLDGESHPELRRTYSELLEKVRARRETDTLQFSEWLARSTEAGALPPDVIGIERVLEEVVTPVAARKPTLLIVLDGMSRANFIELARSIEGDHGCRRHLPQERERWPAVLSVLPSVTEASRCSLFSGKVAVGGQAEEANGFHEYARTKGWRRSAGESLIFHRADLMADSLGRMDGTLEKAIFSTAEVVAVVVNAIDDQLAKGEQLRPVRSVGDIQPLERLVGHARHANRVIVLTCDHGHVVEEKSLDPRIPGERERWRTAEPPAVTGEVLVRGSRVALPQRGGPCVLAASESIRYTARHGGYHGGAAPQEVLVSVAVFVPPGVDLVGWKLEAESPPAWWEEAQPAPLTPVVPEREAKKPQQVGLFEPLEPTTRKDRAWLEAMLSSPVLKAQKQLAGRSPLKDEELRGLLEALEQRGWSATPTALAAALGLNAVQLGVRLTAARRLLNVEGYAVLEVDESASLVRLHRALLSEQFGLAAP